MGTAVLVTAAIAPGMSAAQSGSAGAFDNGTGTANATALRVNPVNGGLSFGVSVGESLAGHQNTVGSAESRAANLGVIGTTLAGEGCDGGDPTLPAEQQPQPLYIDSTLPNASEGLTTADQIVPVLARYVRATLDPFAESTTTVPGIDIPGIIKIGTIESHASSGVFGDHREARATVTIGTISLLGGVISIDGLRWEAVHRSGDTEDPLGEATGSFTVGHATGPLNIPLPVEGLFNLLELVNNVLRPLGLEIRLPKFHVDTTAAGTLATVDPLVVAIIPAPLRDDNITGPLLQAIQPLRQALTNALIENDCSNGTYVTILDVALSTITRGGSLGIELGGVQASTAAITRPTPPTTATTTRPASTPTTARTNTSGNGSTCCATATTARTNTTQSTQTTTVGDGTGSGDDAGNIDDAVETADVSGERGGPLLAVGAGGVLLLLLTAEGDRRKMRRAQREIPTEG